MSSIGHLSPIALCGHSSLVFAPSLAFSPGVVEGQEPGGVQAFGPDLAVEGLGEGAVGGLARPAEVQGGA